MAPYLELQELKRLNYVYKLYSKLAKSERKKIEKSLLKDIAPHFKKAPIIAFLFLAASLTIFMALHFHFIPAMNINIRLTLFSSFFVGVFAPLSLYMLPKYRVRALFRIKLSQESAAVSFFSFLGILWTLFFISSDRLEFFQRTGGLTLIVICIGAAIVPVIEEIFFREIIPSMFGKAPYYFGHVIGAIAFSTAHIPTDGPMFLKYIMAALFLSVTRLQTGGLFYPCLIHILANVTFRLIY